MSPKTSDEKDRRIIRELVLDARQSNVALAAKLGLSEGSVRRRVDKMVSEEKLHFAAIPSPTFMGRPVHTMFRIRSVPGSTESLIEAMVELPEMAYVYHNTGEHDITAVGYFGSSEEMSTFANDILGNLDGVAGLHTIMVLRVAKRAHEWSRTAADTDIDQGDNTGTLGS